MLGDCQSRRDVLVNLPIVRIGNPEAQPGNLHGRTCAAMRVNEYLLIVAQVFILWLAAG